MDNRLLPNFLAKEKVAAKAEKGSVVMSLTVDSSLTTQDGAGSVNDETATQEPLPTTTSETQYEPIPWKPTSDAGVEQGASAGDDPGFGSIEYTQDVFTPGGGIVDTSGWKLTLPADLDGDGDADEIDGDLAEYSSDYFMTNPDGSVWMTTGTGDMATTENSSYGRTELRGMIDPAAGDKEVGNNMVLSTAPAADQEQAGAVDGTLTASLSVDLNRPEFVGDHQLK